MDRISKLLAEGSAVSKEVMLQSLVDEGSMAPLRYNEQKFHPRIKTRTEFVRIFPLMCHLRQATLQIVGGFFASPNGPKLRSNAPQAKQFTEDFLNKVRKPEIFIFLSCYQPIHCLIMFEIFHHFHGTSHFHLF